jgi:zinc D-Ala-D-Ala carboxypeptidase
MATQLTPHFSLEELQATQHREIDNAAPSSLIPILTDTATRMEAVRTLLGDRVITVSSGYRCPALNTAVGGSPTSAHMSGHAVDFNCYGFGDPLAVCRALAASDIPFDQVIREYTWTHISFDPRMRRQTLTAQRGHYVDGLDG